MENNPPLIVGNDADSHGCKASAGYSWSVLKNECIRLWETGVQLSSIDNKASYTSIATVIINDDKTKAELFIVGEKNSIVLNKHIQNFSGDGYELTQVTDKWVLKKNDKAIYKE